MCWRTTPRSKPWEVRPLVQCGCSRLACGGSKSGLRWQRKRSGQSFRNSKPWRRCVCSMFVIPGLRSIACLPSDSQNIPADACTDLERLAQSFDCNFAALKAEWMDFRGRARWHAVKSGCTNICAWKKAIEECQEQSWVNCVLVSV